jgi:O-antigen/teichoic acid export membrane protein
LRSPEVRLFAAPPGEAVNPEGRSTMGVTVEQPRLSIYRRFAGLFVNKLARASIWLFVGGLAAGVLGYVFQVVMGRMLTPREYGLFGAMMALFTVVGAPVGTLMMVVSRKVSEYRAREDSASIAHFYRSIHVRTAIVGAVALGVVAPFAPGIQAYLRSPGIAPVYLLGMLLFVTFLPIVNNAFLQGLQSFSWLSASGVLGVLLKIVFSVALVGVGYGVSGALGGAVLSALALFVITYGALHARLREGRKGRAATTHLSLRSMVPVLAANLAFASMTQLDMVLVNYYFEAHEAGLYAAASVLGKAVMYLPGGIAMALFPMVAENRARDQSSAHLLLQSIVLTGLPCLAGAVFYLAFGDAIIAVLYGESYEGAGSVLRYFGLAMLPMALLMVMVNFYVAEGRALLAYLFTIAAPLQLVAIHFFHGSLQTVVAVIGLSGLALALVGYGLLWRASRE